jgi:hypothetical protein
MPQISPVIVADMLDRYMRQNRKHNTDIAKATGLCAVTIGSFIKKKTAQANTIELIEMYLKENGVLTRLNLPTVPHVVPTPHDTQIMKDMGIENTTPRRDHYVCAYLDDWEFAQLVTAIMQSTMTEEAKRKMLGTMMTQTFGQLSKPAA